MSAFVDHHLIETAEKLGCVMGVLDGAFVLGKSISPERCKAIVKALDEAHNGTEFMVALNKWDAENR